MMFRTAFERGETTYSPEGSHFMPEKEVRIDKKTGKKIIVEVGKTNLYELIQASLESTKIENIIKRFTEGDTDALNQVRGNYLDLTELPTNLMEMQNLMLRTKAEFEKLPVEIKNKFGNSAEAYISAYGTEEWIKAMGLNEKPKIEIKKEGEQEGKKNE